jgi:solute carrier family 25 (mitochondrial phosphate transporter), member 3
LTNQSFGKATLAIVKNDGMNALLAGLGPTTIGYLLEGAIKFGIYEILKPVSGRFMATLARVSTLAFLDSSVLGFVMCGVVSGIAASVVLCPMEALRIRLVAEPDFAPDGWIQGGYKMLKNEGVTAVWKGMTPMLYKQVPYTVAKNVSFDVFTKLAYSILLTSGRTLTGSMKMIVPLLSAVFASMISCISSQPGDMLLSLVNAHEGPKRTNDFLKEILESEQGARRLFVGIKSRFLHVGVIVTVQLMLYDLIKRLCGIAATGTI